MNKAHTQGGQPSNLPPLRPMGGPGGHGGRGGPRVHVEKPKNMGKTLGRLLKYIGKSKMLVIGLIIIISNTISCCILSPRHLEGHISSIVCTFLPRSRIRIERNITSIYVI